MPENDFELHSVAWSKVFPFVRLFRTFKLAIDARLLTLALACVLICYFAGRVLDRIWLAADAGVVKAPRSEIDAYATLGQRGFARFVEQARQDYQRRADAAQRLLDTADQPQQEIAEALARIDEQLARRLAALDDRPARKQTLRRQADYLRLILAGKDAGGLLRPSEEAAAVEAFVDQDPPRRERAEQQARFRALIDRQRTLGEIARLAPQGPFISLLRYEMRCFAAAVQGVCAGRWGLAGGAPASEPTMLGSVVFAGKGLLWLITQRPWYALVYGVVLLLVFSYFGGAICRCVAIRLAREEGIELRAALRFAREKFAGLFMAPLVPAGILAVGALLMFLGGLVGAIPVVGEVLSGVLYGLALLGGFALALILLGSVLGHNLMAPTIAAEGSDAFDAVQHAFGYVGQRPWYAGFYAFVLLLYGGVCFVMVRLMAVVLFKVTHLVTGAGMSLFGTWSSSQTDTFGKLDAMWHMPAWSELSLLPALGGVPFWGKFGSAPLSGSETVGMILIAVWVFLCVGLVGAFVVSFYFAGSTQMYFLLRHHVDAVDWDEVYYEEQELPDADERSAPAEPAAPQSDQAESSPDEAPPPEAE